MSKYKKLYAEMKDIATQAIDEAYRWRGIAIENQLDNKKAIKRESKQEQEIIGQKKMIEDLQEKLKMEICKHQRQVSQSEEVKADLKRALQMNTENLRLLDSYIETNARQAQDIIELESVAIALYDYVWHHVHSVEDELKSHEGVTDLNAYKTIKALFEAEGEEE